LPLCEADSVVVWMLLLASWLRFPLVWQEQNVHLTLLNGERTPDRRYVLLHFQLRATDHVAAFRWQDLCRVINRQGEPIPQAADCGVDTGEGNRITMGPFPLKKNAKARLLLYYLAQPSDFPVQIQRADQPVGLPLP
jgi:hypothetical protein